MPENVEKKQKQRRVSMEEQISRMKLAFSNAKLPHILAQLQTVGYTQGELTAF